MRGIVMLGLLVIVLTFLDSPPAVTGALFAVTGDGSLAPLLLLRECIKLNATGLSDSSWELGCCKGRDGGGRDACP